MLSKTQSDMISKCLGSKFYVQTIRKNDLIQKQNNLFSEICHFDC